MSECDFPSSVALKGMLKIDLSGRWRFAYSAAPGSIAIQTAQDIAEAGLAEFPCTVPGNFELDLVANGIFEGDPFYGMNIARLRSFESSHVWYFRNFEAPTVSDRKAAIVFEGIDCVAEIFLNGKAIGTTDNMLIPHEFDVTSVLCDQNEILVHISPPSETAKKYPYPPAVSTMPHMGDSLYIRKPPHCYGWDIMPRAISAGLWRPVTLELRSSDRFDWAYIATSNLSPSLDAATITIRYLMDLGSNLYDRYEIEVLGSCGDSTFYTKRRLFFVSGRLDVRVDHPKIWWPKGFGEAELYSVEVRLLKDGEAIDTIQARHGIRTVELERTLTTDAEGNGKFCFLVNAERIFVKGTNWVPADAYHSRDFERIPRILDLVDDIGCNMIRCWGGNVYENDLFYDLCDEKGILVWQDFTMACSVYPQDAEFCRRLAIEARAVVRRLRQHPCIALWAGDNECDESWLGSAMRLNPTDNVLTRKILPDVLREEDPYREYLPSSPYYSEQVIERGPSSLPEAHLWGVRHNHRADFYKHANCHFVSEVGFLSCPAVSSLKRFIPEDWLWPSKDNPIWKLHCTSPIPEFNLFDYRVDLLAQQVETFFGSVPENLDDFVFATQAVQAEAMKFIIERFRAQMWRKTGILWWNIMDGWPQFSDAVVDYYFERKLAYEFIRRAQNAVSLIVHEEKAGAFSLVAVNDSDKPHELAYRIRDLATGEVIVQGVGVAEPRAANTLVAVPLPSSTPDIYGIEWSTGSCDAKSHYAFCRSSYDLLSYRDLLERYYGTVIR